MGYGLIHMNQNRNQKNSIYLVKTIYQRLILFINDRNSIRPAHHQLSYIVALCL